MAAALSNGDYTPPSTKRVSYILPPIYHAPRLFQLPTLDASLANSRGRSGPLLISSGFDGQSTFNSNSYRRKRESSVISSNGPHPRHTLPVSSLALDTSTILGGNQEREPKGILYTGGRDGMISAWELGLRMKKRKSLSRKYQPAEKGEEEEEEEGEESAAGFLDEQTTKYNQDGTDYDLSEWGIDAESEDLAPSPAAAKFRQCIGSHTDWINDILLCNQNQTVISASSDRSVKIWNPHDPNSSLTPQILGTHNDYVKALAYAPRASWIASGSFDQTIKVWDIKEMRSSPIMTVTNPQLRASIYGLSVNSWGSVIAAASPEKTIQLFDLRSGNQISQLVGHTDTVRSVVLSQDGGHLLSASSDSTIRLWSIAEQRCLHTFTHHNDSVWSLFSDHSTLDVFYSGDRSGVVCKVDWERCNEVSEGECIVLAKEKRKDGDAKFNRGSVQDSKSTGIYKIVAADNAYFWTANSNSEVSRWKDVSPRSKREALYPIRAGPSSSSAAAAQARTASTTARPSALRGQFGGWSSMTATSVSFAEKATAMASSPPYTSSDAPYTQGDHQAATMYGIPFDSLVCLAPPNDLYGEAIGLGSISMRGIERKESNAVFSSASLISIPSVLKARDSIGGYSPAAGIAGVPDGFSSSPFNASSNRQFEGARPSSMKSASIRFAPLRSHQLQDDSVEDEVDVDGVDETQEESEAVLEARQAFEERDSAMDATPFRSAPQDVIHGSHGLIRSSMLNDRRHVLTIDSAGHIFLWDIVTAQCLGAFDWYQVVEAWSQANDYTTKQAKEAHLLPGEALDIVKERIQGQGTTPMWCTVDTKIGALSVHFDYPRCFDAEIYLDEIEDVLQSLDVKFSYKEDQRVNLGKLVLRNLFDGFISREAKLRSGETARLKKQVLAIERPEILLDKPDLKLELGRKGTLTKRTESNHTPGMTIALAVAAKTPAILTISSPLTPKTGTEVPGLQQMLNSNSNGNITSQADDKAEGLGNGDYFSLEKRAASDKPQTPQAKSIVGGVTTTLNSPGSPGGSGLMGRLRMSMKRSDTKKEEKGTSISQTVGLALSNGGESVSGEDGKGVSAETKQYVEAIRKVMAKADPSKVLEELPHLDFPLHTSIMISETVSDAITNSTTTSTNAVHLVDYRGLVKSTGNDMAALEVTTPTWLLESLVGASDDSTAIEEKDKLTFLLIPWGPGEGEKGEKGEGAAYHEKMPAMPTGNSRLTATKMLRIKKACAYVADKLNMLDEGSVGAKSRTNSIVASRRGSAANTAESNTAGASIGSPSLSMTTSTAPTLKSRNAFDSSSSPSSTPTSKHSNSVAHDMIEILCNGTILPPHCTLSQVQRFYWKSSNVIRLEYRQKQPR